MNKLILIALLLSPLANSNTLRDNTVDVCMQVGIKQLSSFSVWDYDLSYKGHTNNNYTVMYRHEDYPSLYVRCLYVNKTNRIEWNTMHARGYYTLPKNFSKKSMTLTLN